MQLRHVAVLPQQDVQLRSYRCGESVGKGNGAICRDGDSSEGEQPSDTTSQVPDALPLAGSGTDWREFRAQLVASAVRQEQGEDAGAATGNPRTEMGDGVWAHPIPRPEKGCLLIAHPLMFQESQVYFRQVGHRASTMVRARPCVMHAQGKSHGLKVFALTCSFLASFFFRL